MGIKITDSNGKTVWVAKDGNGLPEGGTTGQVLKKDNEDASWGDINASEIKLNTIEGMVSTNLQAGIEELKANINNSGNGESITAANVTLSSISGMTSTNVQAGMQELFTNVSNGKSTIASAITGKGVSTSATATFATMADNIQKIVQNNVKEITFSVQNQLSEPIYILSFETNEGGEWETIPANTNKSYNYLENELVVIKTPLQNMGGGTLGFNSVSALIKFSTTDNTAIKVYRIITGDNYNRYIRVSYATS